MPPRKIKGHWYVDAWILVPGEGRQRLRKRSPVDTRKGAEAFERQLVEAALSTSTPSAPAPTVEAFAQEFLVWAANNNKFSEVESKESILRMHLIPAFGPLRLSEVTARGIEAYKATKRQAGLSPKTINNQLTVLKKMLAIALEWKLVDEAPEITWCKRPVQKFDFFSFDEAAALVEGADAGLARTMIFVALRTGLRLGELLALRWADVARGKVVVSAALVRGRLGSPKNGKQREVPLSPEAAQALEAWRKEAGGRRYVFSRDKAEPLSRGETKWPLYRACAGAGLRKVGWHVLRHTFASHLAMKGVPLKAVQELLGHSSIEMTMRYAHLSPAAKDSAVALLDGQHPGSR